MMTTRAKSNASSRAARKSKKQTNTRRRKNPIQQPSKLRSPEASRAPKRDLALRQSPSSISDQDPKNRALADFQPDLLADVAYLHLSNKMALSPNHLEMTIPAVLNFQKQMRPKDALERLALTQALLAHARVTWLTKQLVGQTETPALAVISEATERAAGTFGRLMRAFAEYRHPKTPGTTVSLVQANVAHQQVVQNVDKVEVPEGKK